MLRESMDYVNCGGINVVLTPEDLIQHIMNMLI